MGVEVGLDHLVQAVTETWTALVGPEIELVDVVEARRATQHVSAICMITGGWTGAVAVDLPFMLAVVSTAAMHGRDPGTLLEEDVFDAVGELANVAAGVLKGNLRVECHMAIPTIFEGSGFTLSVPGAQVSAEAIFAVGRQHLRALLYAPKARRLALSGMVVEQPRVDVV